MKFQEYLKTVTDKIDNNELRARFKEEIAEHWEDSYQQNHTEEPEKILGDHSLLAFQINSVSLPHAFIQDLIISAIGGFVTLALLIMLSSFLTPDLDTNYISNKILSVVTMFIGSVFWCGLAWYLYLSWHRRLVARYGQTTRRTVLLFISFVVPIFFLCVETLIIPINVLINDGPLSIIWGSGSELLAIVILNLIFFHASKMVFKKIDKTNHLLTQSRRLLPWLVSFIVMLGSLLLIIDSTNENILKAGLIFTLPLLMAYLCWGIITMAIGFLIMKILGLPLIFGFWLTTFVAAAAGIIIPMFFLLKKKPISLISRLLTAAVVPLMILLPFVQHDIPKIDWQIPLIWSWDDLEKKQLNIVYPWAAPLMRRNDGINVQYRAHVSDDQIVVIQAGGKSYTVTRNGVEPKPTPKNLEVKIKHDGYSLYNELPTGFSCGDEPLENFINTHENTTGPLEMFGIACPTLKYKNLEIAKIHNGSLIDLDLTDDELLAVSINMGSYDPTYVYVVDLKKLLYE